MIYIIQLCSSRAAEGFFDFARARYFLLRGNVVNKINYVAVYLDHCSNINIFSFNFLLKMMSTGCCEIKKLFFIKLMDY